MAGRTHIYDFCVNLDKHQYSQSYSAHICQLAQTLLVDECRGTTEISLAHPDSGVLCDLHFLCTGADRPWLLQLLSAHRPVTAAPAQ